jgi:hypothetical protein
VSSQVIFSSTSGQKTGVLLLDHCRDAPSPGYPEPIPKIRPAGEGARRFVSRGQSSWSPSSQKFDVALGKKMQGICNPFLRIRFAIFNPVKGL